MSLEEKNRINNYKNMKTLLNNYNINFLETEKLIPMIAFDGEIGKEIRPLYFYQAMGRKIKNARILSFGACNFQCPYCKRGGAFRDKEGNIVSAYRTTINDLLNICNDAISKNQIIRLSGGDPVMFKDEALKIGEYVWNKYHQKISLAHNGSSPEFALKMAKYLESAAIDIKGAKKELWFRAGISQNVGEKMYDNSIKVQNILARANVLVDIRTPIFGDTKLKDMIVIASDIVGGGLKNKFWTWRIYKPVDGCSWSTIDKKKVITMIKKIKKMFPKLKIGLRAKWEPNGFLYF